MWWKQSNKRQSVICRAVLPGWQCPVSAVTRSHQNIYTWQARAVSPCRRGAQLPSARRSATSCWWWTAATRNCLSGEVWPAVVSSSASIVIIITIIPLTSYCAPSSQVIVMCREIDITYIYTVYWWRGAVEQRGNVGNNSYSWMGKRLNSLICWQ